MQQKKTYWVDADFHVVDEISEEGRGLYSGKRLEDLALGRTLTVMTAEEILNGETEHYKQGPELITADAFMHALEVLPPDNWIRAGWTESFRMPEAHRGLLNWHYVRIGDKHYELLQRRGTPHRDLVALVEAALAAAAQGVADAGNEVPEGEAVVESEA